MTLVYIHGANATPNSWNYMRTQLGDGIMVSYDSVDGFKNNLIKIKKQLDDVSNMQFISHSLGGIYALHLANYFGDKVKCGISMSTPYGGYNVSYVARYYMYWHKLLQDVVPSSWAMIEVNKIKINWPWTNLVTISGSIPWQIEPNDGVVTLKSQRHRKDMELIDINCNHYEIVLNQQAISLIRDRLYR